MDSVLPLRSIILKSIKNQTTQSKKVEHTNRLLRAKQVIELTAISRSYLYQLVSQGQFPRSIQLVPGGSSVAWVEQEVLDWVDSRIQARDSEVA
jgi:prophage regulatory protein